MLRELSSMKINLHQHLNFMYKYNNNESLVIFYGFIKDPNHSYRTSFTDNNFSPKKYSLNYVKYAISFGGRRIWNIFLKKEDKEVQSFSLFQKDKKIISKLFEIENEIVCF